MSQAHPLTVPNAVALSVRQGLNDLCGAINSQHSGATAPGPMCRGNGGRIPTAAPWKIRNATNDA